MSFFTPEQERLHQLFNGPQRDPTADAKKHGFTYQSRRARRGAPLMPDDFMPCGPYTGQHLRTVPAFHLHWVQSQPWAKTWTDWQPVADYIDRFPPPQASSEALAKDGFAPVFYLDALRPCQRTADWKWHTDAILYTLPPHEPELHAFACGALGLRIPWYITHRADNPSVPVLPHYRVSSTRHALALEHLCVHLIDAATVTHHTRQWSQHLSQQGTGTPALADPAPATPKPFQRAFPNGRTCSCTKRPYTKKEAQTHLNARSTTHHRANRTLRIYECPDCGSWHLTHKPL